MKQIIILEQVAPSTYRYALWAAVPLARQPMYAKLGLKSVWTGAVQAENDALAAGSVVEKIDSIDVPVGATIPQIQGFLQSRWADFQNDITNNNHWTRYGTFWDGASWTAGGLS